MTITIEVESAAAPARVWELYSQPGRWSEWAPHVRSPRGLGEPEVRPGARGTVRVFGALPVRATIGAVEAGARWTWAVGPLRLEHLVDARPGGGSFIGLRIDASPALEAGLRVT
jgi:hypothetical protein